MPIKTLDPSCVESELVGWRDSDGRGQCKTRWSSHPPTKSRFHLTTWLVSARQRGRMERGSSCSRRFSGMETGLEQIWFLSNVCLTGMAPSGYRWHHHCSFLNRLVHRSDVTRSQLVLTTVPCPDPSLLTLLATIGLILTLADFIGPKVTVSHEAPLRIWTLFQILDKIFKPESWTNEKEKKLEKVPLKFFFKWNLSSFFPRSVTLLSLLAILSPRCPTPWLPWRS